MNILILAGGFGRRMYPLTLDKPKSLIKIRGKPVIEHILDNIRYLESENIFILTNNKFYNDFLSWFFSFKKKDEVAKKIKLINNGVNTEQEKKGALVDLGFALDKIGISNILVLASDDIFNFNLQELVNLSKEKNSSTIALKLMDKEKIKRFSCVLLDEDKKVTYFKEKPEKPKSNISCLACYYLTKCDSEKFKHALTKLEQEDKDKLGNIVKILLENSQVYGKIFDDFWIDIASLV